MKTITMMLLAAAMACAQDRSAAAVPPRKPAAGADAGPVLPKGAVQVEPNLYRYTDAQGKIWLARRTPFGFSTWEDKPAPLQPIQAGSAPLIQATDLGDTVRFERATPFGKSTWLRKKTELSDDEKGWLEASQGPKATTTPAGPSANGTGKR
jgi:hypothetical protein